MRIVNQLDKTSWRNFVDNHPHGNIFHTPEMFEVFSRSPRHQPELWAAVDNNLQPLALFTPVKVTLHGSLLRFFTTRSVAYGGVLWSDGSPQQTETISLLFCTYQKNTRKTLFTELRHHANTSKIQPVMQSHCFDFEQHDNYLINLACTAEQVFERISKSTRKNIRKALKKKNLIIEEVDDLKQLSNWYTIIKKTYRQARVPLARYGLFENTFNLLRPKGMAQFLVARVDNQFIAASVSLLYKDKIYGWYRGFDRQFSKYLPNDLMVWYLLKWGIENGYRVFDFGGAGKPDKKYGPRQFKAKFGGELVSYGRNICIHSALALRLSQASYQIYREHLLRWLRKNSD